MTNVEEWMMNDKCGGLMKNVEERMTNVEEWMMNDNCGGMDDE